MLLNFAVNFIIKKEKILWKKIRYYTYAAIIIILSGIYIYNLNPSVQHVTGIKNVIDFTYINYFVLLASIIVCLINVIKTLRGTGKISLMRYGSLTDEEKKLYSISKVKMSQILYFLSLAIVVALAFVSLIYPNIIDPMILLVCCLIEIAISFIFENTKLILNWFCRK